MTKESTPPPADTTTTTTTNKDNHQPPSLPASPLAKRPKPTPDESSNMATPANASNGTSNIPLFVKKLNDAAKPPTRGSAFAAGYDLYAAAETVIPARGKAMVETGIAVGVPVGCCMFLPFYFVGICSKYMLMCLYRWPCRPSKWSRSQTFHRCRCWGYRCGLSW